MDEPELVYEPFASDAQTAFVRESLYGINFSRTGLSDWQPVNVFLHGSRKDVLGGVLGHVWGGWMHVDILWVTEALRGHGQGTRLMDAAEALARDHGAIGVTLESFSFQAPGFYQRRGYVVCGQIDNYPPGHTKYILRKDLI